MHHIMNRKKIDLMTKKIVLAYSGGLDTSVILKWLQLNYDCPVATYTARYWSK